MAQILARNELSQKEIDNFVAQQLTGVIVHVFSKEFKGQAIRNGLKVYGIEISENELFNSIKRLSISSSWEIKISCIPILPSDGAGYKFRFACDVELAQKTQKEA